MIKITYSGNPTFSVADRDVTVTVNGLSYQAAILPPDDENPDAYSVYLFSGRREASASIPVDGGCESLSMLLAAMIQGQHYNADVAALAASLAGDDFQVAAAPIAAAAREIELTGAPASVRNAATADMTAADIRRAAKTARDEKAARRAARDKARAAKAAAAGHDAAESRQGNGWELVFDRELQRTRLIFAAWPGRTTLAAVKAAGFSWNAAAHEWRRGLNDTSRAAALALVAGL